MAATLAPAQFKSRLSQGVLDPIYVLMGEEDLLRDEALAALKRAALGGDADDFNCDVFYGDEADGASVIACASEVAVFAARRLVIVKAADRLPAKHADPILAYLKNPNEATTVVFIAPKLDGRLKFTQALVQNAVVVDCSPLAESQLGLWLKQEADELGLALSDDALPPLRETCGGSLYAGKRELEKLAAYVGRDRIATPADVAALRGTEPGASVFDLAAAIGAQHRGRALAIVARNLEAGEAPLKILGSLAWQYRRLWKAKAATQAGREGEAARTLRMAPYQVRTFLGQFPEAHLRTAFQSFLACDAQLKGGSSGKPAMILDRLILTLCARPEVETKRSAATSPAGLAPVRRARTLSNVRTITSDRSRSSRGE